MKIEAITNSENEPRVSIWHRDWRESKAFSKVFVVALCLPFLAILLLSAVILFGIITTGAYCIFLIVGFKSYDLWQVRQRHAYLWNWEKGMRRDGWVQVAENRWEIKYWDYCENRYIIHRYFTNERISKRLVTQRLKFKRHPSYIVHKKRIRRH